MKQPSKDVLGIGNAIVDVLAKVDEKFLIQHGMPKGSMTLIDEAQAEGLYNAMGPGVECSGGSAANTVAGIASLGGHAAYIGKVRDDQLGQVFAHDIRAAGVGFQTAAASAGPATARCMVLVTDDAQRTMGTFLGASATLGPDDIDPQLVADAKVTYLEGYLWDPEPAKEAFLKAARIAKENDRKVSLSLSDGFCVDRHRESFLTLVDGHVDILFANEDELKSLFEVHELEAALTALGSRCEIAAITRGADGSTVVGPQGRIDVPAQPVELVLDTTGAGDLYAAGFLYGWSRGETLETCARLGSLAAAEIISHVGARPATRLADWVRNQV